MDYRNLRFELADGVATITLDRPDAANAIDLALARELMQVAIRCDEDPGVRAVLLTGAGKMFCPGGDLKSFASAGAGLPSLLKEITTHLHAATSRFARMSAPLVVAVNGAAAGAGFSIAIAGDLVLNALGLLRPVLVQQEALIAQMLGDDLPGLIVHGDNELAVGVEVDGEPLRRRHTPGKVVLGGIDADRVADHRERADGDAGLPRHDLLCLHQAVDILEPRVESIVCPVTGGKRELAVKHSEE